MVPDTLSFSDSSFFVFESFLVYTNLKLEKEIIPNI